MNINKLNEDLNRRFMYIIISCSTGLEFTASVSIAIDIGLG